MAKQHIFNLVSDFFEGNNDKTFTWFTTIHPSFGQTPIDMIRKGRHDKLLKHVLAGLDAHKI